MPVYLLRPKHSGGVADLRLVRATSRSQAMRHVAETHFDCEVAKSETVAELMVAGKRCEDARQPETADLVEVAQSAPPTEEPPPLDPYLQGIADRHNEAFIEEVEIK